MSQPDGFDQSGHRLLFSLANRKSEESKSFLNGKTCFLIIATVKILLTNRSFMSNPPFIGLSKVGIVL